MSEGTGYRSRLLVSVRSAAEAAEALAGGADVIDVKEPSRGSLGRADDAVIGAVVACVAGRRPVSAALGDFPVAAAVPACLAYVKWGFAGAGAGSGTEDALKAELQTPSAAQVVLAAYADWQRAAAPAPETVAGWAAAAGAAGMLLDTYQKDGRTLLDWMTITELAALVERCRHLRLQVALAGSLTAQHIAQLRGLRPDWFAVRGAACRLGARAEAIDRERVQALADILASR